MTPAFQNQPAPSDEVTVNPPADGPLSEALAATETGGEGMPELVTGRESTVPLQKEPGPNLLPGLLLAGGVGLLVVISLRKLRTRTARRTPMDRDPSERIAKIREDAAANARRQPVESLMADAEELTRRLAAILDNKAARIEVLLEQADERLERLERASEPRPSRKLAHASGAGAHPISRVEFDGVDPVHQRIYELSDQGRNKLEIARELKQPIGQIELVLALRR